MMHARVYICVYMRGRRGKRRSWDAAADAWGINSSAGDSNPFFRKFDGSIGARCERRAESERGPTRGCVLLDEMCVYIKRLGLLILILGIAGRWIFGRQRGIWYAAVTRLCRGVGEGVFFVLRNSAINYRLHYRLHCIVTCWKIGGGKKIYSI